MENMSKALLMAGGVLIAILVISLFAYMFTSMSGVFQSKEDIKYAEEIEEYNKEYLSYNRKLLRGADLISLMNKANDSYQRNGNVDEYKITVKYKLTGETTYSTTYSDFNEFKRKIFNCEGVSYNASGRISEMRFIEKDVT